MVVDHGAVLLHTPDNFFWAKSRWSIWPTFAQRGLHPRAVISVDPTLVDMVHHVIAGAVHV
jgi:hypothetical protein